MVNPCAGVELGLEINGERGAPVIPYGRTVTVSGVLHCGTVAIRDAQVAIATVGGPASVVVAISADRAGWLVLLRGAGGPRPRLVVLVYRL